MARTTGKSVEELKTELAGYKSSMSPEDYSSSKKVGKVIDAIKVLEPQNYGDETVANAKQKLATSTQQPNAAGGNSGGSGASSGGGVGTSGDLNTLFDQLNNSSDIQAKKTELANLQKARDEAIGETQSNPWYSQSTRGGKIAAINSDAERNISRVSGELTNLQTEAQNKYNVALQQMQLNKPTVQMYQDAYGNQWKVTLDSQGKVLSQENLGGGKSISESDPFRYLTYLQNAGLLNSGTPEVAGASDTAPTQAPQMSAAYGATVEYPAGSGWIWTMGQNGWE